MTKREEEQSALLKDISNFRTPKRPPKANTPAFQTPHTASVYRTAKQIQTPGSASASFLRRRSVLPSAATRSTAARRLKEIELQQSQSSRKAELHKERSLKSLSKSLTAWLNFLFQNPRGCGCERLEGDVRNDLPNGNRTRDIMESPGSYGFGLDEEWRNPKRCRNYEWSSVNVDGGETLNAKMFSALRASLKEVCSFDDLLQRMRAYLSLDSCTDIFNVMTKVTTAIDEGRLKMKAHCPLVTDFGIKEKATQTLLCYNPTWLQIGLHIIFGGDSLLPNGDVSADLENGLLQMVIEKQFFSHAGLAKVFAYNKNVEGIYRPGYFEELGNVILKRFLLLVLILDRAKSQRTLPLKFGIDGIDGGSPQLFTVNSDVKASRQMVHEFLSTNVMHGEGNLLAHLEMIRFKVSHQQEPLLEYCFRVSDLFEDLQDGVLICRVIQLLQHDSSILLRLAVPSDSLKKKLSNCSVALQYLKQAGVPLQDDDGVSIISEDIALGDKELTLSLLWNIFVHLQIPLLIKNSLFSEEISKIRGTADDTVSIAVADPLALLLSWVQVVCQKYDCQVNNFTSLVDGKVMWCLLDYYFRKELHCSCAYKDRMGAESIVSASEYTDGVHNFVFSQKLTTLLGNFPEMLQISDLLEYNGVCNERSVIILLVFLSSELTVKRNMDQLNFHKLLGCTCGTVDRKQASPEQLCLAKNGPPNNSLCCVGNDEFARNFQASKAWWQDITLQNHKHEDTFDIRLANHVVNCTVPMPESTENENTTTQREKAARVIQSFHRQFIARRKYLKLKDTASFLQVAVRSWLAARKNYIRSRSYSSPGTQQATLERLRGSERLQTYSLFMEARHKFIMLKRSALLIQRAVRMWISCRQSDATAELCRLVVQGDAVIIIQSHVRRWLARRRFLLKKKTLRDERHSVNVIQRIFRRFKSQKAEQVKVNIKAAIIIQSLFRRWIVQRKYRSQRHHIITLQGHVRFWLKKKSFSLKRKSAVKIQSLWRAHKTRVMYVSNRRAVTNIQCVVRGQISRKRLLGSSNNHRASFKLGYMNSSRSFELDVIINAIIKLQRWWRDVLLHRLKKEAALIIQAHVRGWLARRYTAWERDQVIFIQSHWKGYLARKGSKQDLIDLRSRVKKSAANIDDSKRLMNRLLAALSELLSMKSISNILHTCETLDTATKHSQKCCEELVAAGAVHTLLKLIQSVSRSIPDQEVLKYALSTLRNLARYPQLTISIISANRSVEIIILEMLRNKEDAYFTAAELMKKICSTPEGIKAVHSLPGFMKRLHSHIEDLKRKISFEKRNPRANLALKETVEKRLHEALEILKIATTSR